VYPTCSLILMNILTVFFLLVLGKQGDNTCVKKDASTMQNSSKEIVPDKMRWAIIALVKPNKADIMERNADLLARIKPYSHLHNITVVFFSEMTFPAEFLPRWEKMFKGVANVRLINTASNGFNAPERFGYKYMCKFFSLDLYGYLRNDYDYYMRCDTDCYLKILRYDIFQWAKDNDVGYGFSMRKLEAHGPTKQTLPMWTEKYVESCSIQASAPMDNSLKVCFNFYNNFHIVRAANASGHILSHRWGDSTIQAYAVRLFMNPSSIVQLPNFSYVHGSHNAIVNTFGDGSRSNVPQRLPNWKYTPGLENTSQAIMHRNQK
jgi:hypothetical protein